MRSKCFVAQEWKDQHQLVQNLNERSRRPGHKWKKNVLSHFTICHSERYLALITQFSRNLEGKICTSHIGYLEKLGMPRFTDFEGHLMHFFSDVRWIFGMSICAIDSSSNATGETFSGAGNLLDGVSVSRTANYLCDPTTWYSGDRVRTLGLETR